jgi:hypothetical protein
MGLWRHIERPRYHAGNRIRIPVSEPGHVSERAEVEIRRQRKPLARLLR